MSRDQCQVGSAAPTAVTQLRESGCAPGMAMTSSVLKLPLLSCPKTSFALCTEQRHVLRPDSQLSDAEALVLAAATASVVLRRVVPTLGRTNAAVAILPVSQIAQASP